MSASTESAQISRPTLAAQFGGNYIDYYKLFQWIDGMIYHTEKQRIAFSSLNEIPEKLAEFESIVRDWHGDLEQSGLDLQQDPITMLAGVAAPTFFAATDQTACVLPQSYKLPDGSEETTLLYKPVENKLKSLHSKGHFNPVYFNDGRMVMEYVSKRLHQLDPKLMKQMREPGLEYFQDNDIYAHFISGQGANGAVGRLVRQESGEFNLEDYHSYEPAHLSMPLYDKEPNCFIEGEGRIAMLDSVTGSQAPAEYYVAGCPDKKTHIGPTATILNLIQKCQKDPQVVVDTFNDLFASWHEQGLFEGCASPNKYSLFLKYILGSEGDQQNPASGLSYFTAHPDQQTTRGLGIQAKDGNRAAQAVLLFSAYRQADFMIESLKNEDYNEGNPSRVLARDEVEDGNTEAKGRLKLVTYTGGLARGYHDDYPDCWNLIQNRLRRAFGEQVELVYVEPQAKFDGAIELAEDVVSSKISYPIVTEPKTNQWTDWASAQIKKFTELKLSL